MANVTRTTGTYTAHTNAAAADVESDVSNLYNTHNLHDAGTSKWTVVSALNALATPMIADNSTGTNSIVEFKDNGTTVWSIADGGNLVSASKLITGLAAGTAAGHSVRFEQLKVLSIPVYATTTTAATSTSSTFADTNLSGSITPSSTSSKVLVIVAQSCDFALTAGQGIGVLGLRLLRDAVAVFTSTSFCGGNFGANTAINGWPAMPCLAYLDSPATTSAVTYKTQFNRLSGADGTVKVQTGSSPSVMILIEVAGS